MIDYSDRPTPTKIDVRRKATSKKTKREKYVDPYPAVVAKGKKKKPIRKSFYSGTVTLYNGQSLEFHNLPELYSFLDVESDNSRLLKELVKSEKLRKKYVIAKIEYTQEFK